MTRGKMPILGAVAVTKKALLDDNSETAANGRTI
jgi:hypothetical protein